jgi:hypothetical protein
MPLSKEELLRPRYEAINDYPRSPFRKGDIIYPTKIASGLYGTAEIDNIDKYPNIFRKMNWWERKLSELPQYIKWQYAENGFIGTVTKWEKGFSGIYCITNGFISFPGECCLLPSDESEYLEYIKSLESK